jgi:signal transduction histidine kinase
VVQDYPDVLPKIYLDRRQMGYVIYQVIKNAVDAVMDKQVQTRPPLITISADQTASHVYLHIRDNGVGIPAKQLPDVFEPLRSTKSRGIGLGLAIAKRMMEANNAEIILESTENEGTTAIIKLPIVKE